MQIIDGKALADKIKDEIVNEIMAMNPEDGTCPDHRPNLAIILVGEREDSKLYVSLKEKEARKVGIDTNLYVCEADITEEELLKTVEFLNADKQIDAILIQLPLPEHINTDNIIKAIDPKKDVDGFHPDNLKKILGEEEKEKKYPPLAEVVLEILRNIDFDSSSKQALAVVNSDIFGEVISVALKDMELKVETIGPEDKNLSKKVAEADLLVTAVGRPGLITGGMLKNEAVVIDIGITKVNGQVRGDVDFETAKDVVAYITPVPGGVGPLTIAMAFKRTLEIYKKRYK